MPKKRGGNNPPGKRQLKVGEEIRHQLALILQRESLKDPILDDVSVTVTEVQVSPDLRKAKAFVIPLAATEKDEHFLQVVEALNNCAKQIKFLIGKKLHIKNIPNFTFYPDETFAQVDAIEELLRRPEVARDLDKE